MQNNLKDALNNIDEKVDYLKELQALLHGKECCEEVIQKFKEEYNTEILKRVGNSALNQFKPTSDDDLQAFYNDE